MTEKLLLVGSVPYDSAEKVMHTAADMLGEHLATALTKRIRRYRDAQFGGVANPRPPGCG